MAVPSLTRIVSGGQTGPDRAALDVARELAIPVSGWCPRGGRAEDLPDPPGLLARYPELREIPEDDLGALRTRRNARDSTATLILTTGQARSPGTAATRRAARALARPLLVVDVADPAAARRIRAFAAALPAGAALNVAGPRESEAPGIQARSAELLRAALR